MGQGEFYPLKSARDSLHWLLDFNTRHQKFEEYPEMGPSFVAMLKASFKDKKDKDICQLFTTPIEFRQYVYSNFVANGAVVTSCLNDILKVCNVQTEQESLTNCNSTSKMLEMFIEFNLEFYITDELIDRLLLKNFIPKHREEFESAWAMKMVRLRSGAKTGLMKHINLQQQPELSGQLGIALSNTSRPSNTRETSLAPSKNLTTSENSTSKTLKGTLNEHKTFFYAFLVQKQSQLQHCLVKKYETQHLSKLTNQNKSHQRKDTRFYNNCSKDMMGNSQQNTNVKSNQKKDSKNVKPFAIKCQQK